MNLKLVTAPTEEPVTLAQARQHLCVTSTAEDALILTLIFAARRHVEAATRRKLITQNWRIVRDDFCEPIVLPDVAPVSAIVSVKYIDSAGALQTLATSVYQLVPEAPARLVLAFDQVWPDLRGDRDGVRIEVTSGYGAAAAVPEDIKAAMLLLIGHLFDHRSENIEGNLTQMPFAAASLLSPYTVAAF